jgi:hypothetical protein
MVLHRHPTFFPLTLANLRGELPLFCDQDIGKITGVKRGTRPELQIGIAKPSIASA